MKITEGGAQELCCYEFLVALTLLKADFTQIEYQKRIIVQSH